MKRLYLPIFFLCLLVIGVNAQDLRSKKVSDVIENGPSKYTILNTVPGNVIKSDMPDPSGTVPFPQNWYDYYSNGQSLRSLWVIGDTVIVGIDQADSVAAATQCSNCRRTYYQVSFNRGVTWQSSAGIVSQNGNAYPDISPVFSGGVRTIAISGREFVGTTRRCYAGTDIGLGVGVITSVLNPDPPQSIEYFSQKRSSTLLGGVFQSNDSVYYKTFNYTNNTWSTNKLLLAAPPTEIDINGRVYSAVSDDGQYIFIMWWVSTAGDVKMVGKESTDGGTSFGNIITILPYNTVVHSDNVESWFGADLMYKPGTHNINIVINTLGPGNYAFVGGQKILFWNGTTLICVVDRTNWPLMADTTAFYNWGGYQQTGMTSLSHPSINYTSDGNLICVYTADQYPDTASYGARFHDIWESYSTNNGTTWSAPVRLTNTTNLDEIYGSIARGNGNTLSNFGVTYMVTSNPGCTGFDPAPSYSPPAAIVYQVYRRYNAITGVEIPIGVNNISEEVPASYSLSQNYPNPFNPSTTIKFGIPKTSNVTLEVFDVTGRLVTTLVNNEVLTPGIKSVDFYARELASGVYFYTLKAGDFYTTKKMILVK
jgi:hypothetical protein